jgi:adenosylcobyric acid synthase
VLGVCGGYQMLGRRLSDPDGIEGARETAEGLGLLDVETVMTGDKTLRPVGGRLANGARFEGYEMHVGRTVGVAAAMLTFDDGAEDGAVSPDGLVRGCYVHGLFDRGEARAALLAELGARSEGVDQAGRVDRALDEIAGALEQAFDIPALAALAGLETFRCPFRS